MPSEYSNPIAIVMGFDYGSKRIGVAVGNSLTGSAQALDVIQNTKTDQTLQKIKELISEWQPNCLVVGLPMHPDGAEHGMTKRSRSFGQELTKQFGKPVHFVDERYSSVLLEQDSQYQGSVDSHAAGLLLEQFFREHGQSLNE
jgi:putative holliday junction resolvase